MRFIDLLKYSFIKTIRDKRKFYFFSILIICSLLLLGVLNYYNGFFDSFNYFNLYDVSSRQLVVEPGVEEIKKHFDDEDYDYKMFDLKEIEHVQDVYFFSYNYNGTIRSSFKNDEYTGNLVFSYGNENIIPKLIKGNYFSADDTGKAICPSYFYPSTLNEGKFDYLKKYTLLRSDDLIGKKFDIETDKYIWDKKAVKTGTYSKTFEIVGIYDAGNDFDALDKCYVSLGDMKDLYETNTKYINNPAYSRDLSYIVLVDSSKNITSVMKEINAKGIYDARTISEPDEEYISQIKKTTFKIILLVVIGVIVISILYIRKSIKDSSYEVGVNRSLGFLDRQIISVDIIKITIMTLCSSIISLIIYIIVLIVANIIFEVPLLLSHLNIYFDFKITSVLITFAITIIVPAIVVFILSKMNLNNSLTNLIRSEKE